MTVMEFLAIDLVIVFSFVCGVAAALIIVREAEDGDDGGMAI